MSLAAVMGLGLAGCDAGTPESQPIDAPAAKLLAVYVTTGILDGTPVQEPVDGAKPVTTTTSIRLAFDRFLLPGSAIRQSVCLRSAPGSIQTPAECQGGIEFLEPAYDPARREVVYRQLPGGALAADTEYKLSVFSASDPASPIGFRAFDGANLEQAVYEVTFRTNAVDPAGTVEEQAPSTDFWCRYDVCVAGCADPGASATCETDCLFELGVKDTFLTCNGPACHGDGTSTRVAMGLDLTPGGVSLTALQRVAHQTMQGENADQGDVTPVTDQPVRFGRAMPLISPGNPGNSYLLYKLIAGTARPAFSDPTSALPPVSPEEIGRLRASVVVGMPMPPDTVITAAEIGTISAWIAQGAPTSCK